MKEYVGIYVKTEKAQEQDGFGNKMKYHFHITIVQVMFWFWWSRWLLLTSLTLVNLLQGVFPMVHSLAIFNGHVHVCVYTLYKLINCKHQGWDRYMYIYTCVN